MQPRIPRPFAYIRYIKMWGWISELEDGEEDFLRKGGPWDLKVGDMMEGVSYEWLTAY